MALRGYAGQSNSTTSTTVAVTVSGIGGTGPQLNDVVLFFMNGGGSGGSTTLTPPSGFSVVPGISALVLNANTRITCWYKIAGASEPSSYTATSSANDYHSAEVRVYSGRNTTTPFTAVATTADTGPFSSPMSISFTGLTAAAGDDIVMLVGNNNNQNNDGSAALTPPTGFGNVAVYNAPVNYSPPVLACDLTNASAGATGTLSATETWGFTGVAYTLDYGGYVLSLASGGGGGATSLPPSDDWFFSGDDEYQATEAWVEVASTEQPLVANVAPIVVQEDIVDWWWEGYEAPLVSDFEWSGPIQPNAPPLDQPTDHPWDFDAEIIELSGSSESFQNSDVFADQPPADAWDSFDDAFDELHLIVNADERVLSADVIVAQQQPQDVEWQDEDSEDLWFSDDTLGADVIPATSIATDDPWSFEADYVEPTATAEGFQNADVVAPTDLVSPDAWSWDDEVSDETPDDAVLGTNNSAVPVTQPQDPDWSEEDGAEDYELQIDDFANFELDPPEPDAWDWDNEAVDDSFDTDQVLGANFTPPASQPQDVEWDFAESSDDDWSYDEAQQSAAIVAADQHFGDEGENWDDSVDDGFDVDQPLGADVVPSQILDSDWDFTESQDDDWSYDESQQSPPVLSADQHFGDDAENWDDSTVDESDGTRPDDYQLVNGIVQSVQIFEDPWDWSDDADNEPFGLDAQASSDDLAQDDGWDWNEDGDGEPFGLDATTSADAPTDLGQPDSWDWDEDATESADDFSGPVGPNYVPPPSQFTDYGWEWNWDGDFAEIDDHLDSPIQDPPIIYTILAPQRLVLDDYGKRITLGAYEVHIGLGDHLKRLN